jgi:hypothetical protein
VVAIEATFEIPERDEVRLVSLRKYNPELRWWERLYRRLIWYPVVRFGFNHMHIASPSAMQADGTIEFLEQQGVYLDEETANEACKDENYSVKKLPLNMALPEASVQYSGHRAPMSILPDRYRRRRFPGVALGTHRQVAELTHQFETISRTATGK